jgi:hypothetical protein
MLIFFHELGVILYFDESTELNTIVILEPQWLIDELGLLIRDHALHGTALRHNPEMRKYAADVKRLQQKALVSERLLDFLWKTSKVPTTGQGGASGSNVGSERVGIVDQRAATVRSRFLKALVKKMTLICDWKAVDRPKSVKREYLVPCLLPENQTHQGIPDSASAATGTSIASNDYRLDPESSFIFYFDFEEFYLPNGLFERLVCQAVSFSYGEAPNVCDPELAKNAALLSFGSAVFEIRAVPTQRRIVVSTFVASVF